MRLKDKVCIITGATSGIGKRSAEIFAREGARLVIAGRRADLGQAIAKQLNCDFVQTDVTDARRRQQLQYRIEHAQPGAEHRHHDDICLHDTTIRRTERRRDGCG